VYAVVGQKGGKKDKKRSRKYKEKRPYFNLYAEIAPPESIH